MALSDDQRAMLRLLAQREQGYEDMAALMGVSVEELRGRVKDALAQLESEGVAPPALPPEPPAAAEPPQQPVAPPPPVASEPPELSASPPSGAVPPSLPPQPPEKKSGGFSIPSSNGARVAIAAIAAAVVIVVVLLLVGGGGGGDSSSSTTAAETGGTTTAAEGGGGSETASANPVAEAEEAAEEGSGAKGVTKAVLSGAGEAHGIAIFGRVKNKLALQIVAEGLEPLEKGESYAIWIAQSPTKMLPLAASPVNESGQIASQFEVPTEVLSYLAADTFNEIAITRASISKLNATLKVATSKKEPPTYTGVSVMRGEITGPIIGAAKRLEEKEAAEGKGTEAGE